MKSYSIAMAGAAVGLIVILAFVALNNLNAAPVAEVLPTASVSTHAAAPASAPVTNAVEQSVRVVPNVEQSVTVAE